MWLPVTQHSLKETKHNGVLVMDTWPYQLIETAAPCLALHAIFYVFWSNIALWSMMRAVLKTIKIKMTALRWFVWLKLWPCVQLHRIVSAFNILRAGSKTPWKKNLLSDSQSARAFSIKIGSSWSGMVLQSFSRAQSLLRCYLDSYWSSNELPGSITHDESERTSIAVHRPLSHHYLSVTGSILCSNLIWKREYHAIVVQWQ